MRRKKEASEPDRRERVRKAGRPAESGENVLLEAKLAAAADPQTRAALAALMVKAERCALSVRRSMGGAPPLGHSVLAAHVLRSFSTEAFVDVSGAPLAPSPLFVTADATTATLTREGIQFVWGLYVCAVDPSAPIEKAGFRSDDAEHAAAVDAVRGQFIVAKRETLAERSKSDAWRQSGKELLKFVEDDDGLEIVARALAAGKRDSDASGPRARPPEDVFTALKLSLFELGPKSVETIKRLDPKSAVFTRAGGAVRLRAEAARAVAALFRGVYETSSGSLPEGSGFDAKSELGKKAVDRVRAVVDRPVCAELIGPLKNDFWRPPKSGSKSDEKPELAVSPRIESRQRDEAKLMTALSESQKKRVCLPEIVSGEAGPMSPLQALVCALVGSVWEKLGRPVRVSQDTLRDMLPGSVSASRLSYAVKELAAQPFSRSFTFLYMNLSRVCIRHRRVRRRTDGRCSQRRSGQHHPYGHSYGN